MSTIYEHFWSKYQRIKQIAVAKREGVPLLDFVQLKVLYWNLYGLGMASIFRSIDYQK